MERGKQWSEVAAEMGGSTENAASEKDSSRWTQLQREGSSRERETDKKEAAKKSRQRGADVSNNRETQKIRSGEEKRKGMMRRSFEKDLQEK